jgi:hypothetical protein
MISFFRHRIHTGLNKRHLTNSAGKATQNDSE